MPAESDRDPDLDHDAEQSQGPAPEDDRRDRSLWGALALLVLIALIVLMLLSQCTTRVPYLVGMDRTKAEARLENVGLKLGDVSEVPTGQVDAGLVAEQFPSAGSMLRRGSAVDLSVALGGNLATVPNVVGLPAANAAIELQQADFEPVPAEEYSDSVARGIAIRQSPPGGSQAAKGSEVTVYYSLGVQTATGVNVDHTDTDDGLTDATRDSAGSGSLKLRLTRAYPQARAWSSHGDIFVRLTPGSAARRVTSGSPWDTYPVISPSHKYLVFMRATASKQRPQVIGAVSFTSMKTYMLRMPAVPMRHEDSPWVGKPVFAPNESSTVPNSDWIVFPQYWYDKFLGQTARATGARLIVCNVPMDSKWVSWNLRIRHTGTVVLSRSKRAGSVRVRAYVHGQRIYNRNLNLATGLYLR